MTQGQMKLTCWAIAALALTGAVWPSATAEETALDRYVAKPDPAYEYRLISTIEGKGSTTYILEMTSQQFLTE
ncbi:MAG: PhoPQ-activated protein PqaA family protein, partial [Verrucomicrobiota bacterium]|nr:PhoPQ-activated protein PqaA family protein [Verrucomicrobiota bacterium]